MTNSTSHAPHVTACADAVLQTTGVLNNPYFAALSSGRMSQSQFRRTQEQFLFAVSFFPRPMAVLVARIPEPRQRLDILRNLNEEHGDFDEQAFHQTTFCQFLDTLGRDPGVPNQAQIGPAVHAFNNALNAACVLDELETGLACMGIIEYAFSGISAAIGSAVVQRGWVPAENLIHYRLHAEIDARHAEEFFAIIEAAWHDTNRRQYIEQGLALGAYIFDRLYRDLLEAET
ncbi:TenA family transcriptional regulator [Thalassoroseus pseudoceratinae]|uniref:TenA family transcriptional regulator n=1 Tax=Thalassoroseus pseudoceratinae TaxID=2713176 RepID=UPI001421212C|nr:iron-containing redox enzyme family protein [Thalassoroseus pseudoceratinae]